MDKRKDNIDLTSRVETSEDFVLIRYGNIIYFGNKSKDEINRIKEMLNALGPRETVENMFTGGLLGGLIQTTA